MYEAQTLQFGCTGAFTLPPAHLPLCPLGELVIKLNPLFKFRILGFKKKKTFISLWKRLSKSILLDAVDDVGRGYAARLENGRDDVDHMGELAPDAANILDAAGPGNRHALTHTAKMRCDLLEPAEGRVEGPGPGHRETSGLIIGRMHDTTVIM